MSQEKPIPTRFIGLDVHKHYLVAICLKAICSQPTITTDGSAWMSPLSNACASRVTLRLHSGQALDTLAFAQSQIALFEETLTALAAQDERVLLLIQLPGMGLITAMTLLAAIGDISRFPTAKKLVGYSGLGSRVHDSGQYRRTGRMTKAGRRDIRAAMIEAAHTASRTHPHWKSDGYPVRLPDHRAAAVTLDLSGQLSAGCT